MMKTATVFVTYLIVSLANYVQAAPFPKTDLPAFVVSHLNLRSFRNSLRPRMDGTSSYVKFSDLALSPTRMTGDIVEFDSDDWFYSLQIIGQENQIRDEEHLYVCFVDQAKKGTYLAVTPLRLSYFKGKVTAARAASSAACKSFPDSP